MASLLAGESPATFDLRHLRNDATGRAAINLAVFPFEDRQQASVVIGLLGLELLESVFFGHACLPESDTILSNFD